MKKLILIAIVALMVACENPTEPQNAVETLIENSVDTTKVDTAVVVTPSVATSTVK